MSAPTKYILISLPLRIFDDQDDALSSLGTTITSKYGTILPFTIPSFKIGTLDGLVQQADDLAKLDAACEGVVSKVADSLRSILGGDQARTERYKKVNDKSTNDYLCTFNWNKVRYRTDRPLSELIDNLQNVLRDIDNDCKAIFNKYNGIKTNLATLQRRQTGNLSTKSLTPIVDPSLLVQDSEFLETHLIVVPTNARKDFIRSYETLAPMVVPRSAVQVAQDDEFALFAVTTFQKHSSEFLQKCREQKWTPRQYKYVEGGKEEERQELQRVTAEEKKAFAEAVRLGGTSWSESVMVWAHVLTLRVFVETVLRYGLPLDFVCALVKTTPQQAGNVKKALDSAYSYLGGNAFGRDKHGRVTKDSASLTAEMAAAGISGDTDEYTAYVYYEIDLP